MGAISLSEIKNDIQHNNGVKAKNKNVCEQLPEEGGCFYVVGISLIV